jgi:hypothetical protein
VRCVAHVHSTHSDGTATVGELRTAVREAGAQVLLLTDHDSLGARDAGEDGWDEDVLVVAGHEISPRGGHLLVFGAGEVIAHAGRDERAILDAVAAVGAFGIPAHPFSAGSAMSARIGRPHPWRLFDHPAVAGIEVWSLTTDAAEGWASPRSAVRGLRDPAAAVLAGPPAGHLERWDALSARRPLGGLGGLDAHAPGVRLRGRVRSIMPHGRWMGLLQTVLHLDAPLAGGSDDAGAVLRALRAGATTLALPSLGDPLQARAGWSTAPVPGACGPARDALLHVTAPPGTRVRVVRDGAVALEADATLGPFPAEGPGVHRVELWRRPADGAPAAPWLLSSPVLLGASPGGGPPGTG